MRDENARLKPLVADLALDRRVLQEVIDEKIQPRPGAGISHDGYATASS